MEKRLKKFHDVNVYLHFPLSLEKETNFIYLLKFPNGKYYVGQTCDKTGVITRIKQHCHAAFKKKQDNVYKNRIIKKYMLFDVFLLKKCKIEELDFYESFYISILRKRLVNIENGGKKIKILAIRAKRKLVKN